jgi:phosphonopyruvate decarboxylase
MLNPKDFCNLLADEGVEFFCGVPDSLLKNFNSFIHENFPSEKNIIASNEGAAIALAAGYHLATGKIPLVYMQNSGQGNAINPLVSLCDEEVYAIPMIVLIGWRGEPGQKDEPQHIKQGKITLDLLKVLGIPYEILPENHKDSVKTIQKSIKKIREINSPYALIIRKNTFSKYEKNEKVKEEYPLTREETIREIVKELNEKDIVVSTTGKISRELFEIRENLMQSHEKDFLTIGSMGHSSQIALGIALSKKNRNVYCLDGDGSFIMHMGSLTTIGKLNIDNFKHIVLNNGAHESVGGQPTAGFSINVPKIALASGYKNSWTVRNNKELKEKLILLKSSKGPSLLEIKLNLNSREDLGRPNKSPLENKKDFVKFLE